MNFLANKKGLASTLSVIFLVVLSGGLGTGIWTFSQMEIINTTEGVIVDQKAVKVSISALAQNAKAWVHQKVEVEGKLSAGSEETCYLSEGEVQFRVECWAPFDQLSTVNTNVASAGTKTMDYYFDQNWVLVGEVSSIGTEYFLEVESYSPFK